LRAGTRRRTEPLRSWARSQAQLHSELDAVSFTWAVAQRVAAAIGVDLESSADVDQIALADPPDGWHSPWLVGLAHEQAATSSDRTARGAWYTPRSVVEGLVGLALDEVDLGDAFIVDPTCGGGAFLLATLDHLVEAGYTADDAVETVGGIDIDPGAVVAATLGVKLWAATHGCVDPQPNIVCADALTSYPTAWPQPTAVLGNPPFASPLKSDAVNTAATKFREDRPELFGPYADTAACHLVRAVELCAPGGAVCLVQPMSVLSGRDTERMRIHLGVQAPLKAMWSTREAVFDAGIRVIAPVLVPGGQPGPIAIAAGPRPHVIGTSDRGSSWAGLGADALGAPAIHIAAERTLGDLVQATAGFRDEHYGLAAACVEQSDSDSTLRLTTVGSIDPLFGWWGNRPTRFAGQMWERPVIEMELLDGKVRRWVENQLRPKVVLPTQSKVLEPLIDRTGAIVPATPVLAIHTEVHNLNHVAAVLLAPPVVAWAFRRSFGSALSVDAVKLSAKEVCNLPLPVNSQIWDEAASVLAAAEPKTFELAAEVALAVAELMMRAYDAKPEVLDWYTTRFPLAK
jgi:hypothetical protein